MSYLSNLILRTGMIIDFGKHRGKPENIQKKGEQNCSADFQQLQLLEDNVIEPPAKGLMENGLDGVDQKPGYWRESENPEFINEHQDEGKDDSYQLVANDETQETGKLRFHNDMPVLQEPPDQQESCRIRPEKTKGHLDVPIKSIDAHESHTIKNNISQEMEPASEIINHKLNKVRERDKSDVGSAGPEGGYQKQPVSHNTLEEVYQWIGDSSHNDTSPEEMDNEMTWQDAAPPQRTVRPVAHESAIHVKTADTPEMRSGTKEKENQEVTLSIGTINLIVEGDEKMGQPMDGHHNKRRETHHPQQSSNSRLQRYHIR